VHLWLVLFLVIFCCIFNKPPFSYNSVWKHDWHSSSYAWLLSLSLAFSLFLTFTSVFFNVFAAAEPSANVCIAHGTLCNCETVALLQLHWTVVANFVPGNFVPFRQNPWQPFAEPWLETLVYINTWLMPSLSRRSERRRHKNILWKVLIQHNCKCRQCTTQELSFQWHRRSPGQRFA